MISFSSHHIILSSSLMLIYHGFSVGFYSYTQRLLVDNSLALWHGEHGRTCVLQGWCVKSSDPRTLGIHTVPKEVIPGQVISPILPLSLDNQPLTGEGMLLCRSL